MTRLRDANRQWLLSGALLACAVVFFALLDGATLHAATGTTPDASAQTKIRSEIVVQVPLPIMKKGNCHLKENKDKTCVDSYGEYVGLIYRYFSGVIGILAAVMLMWGGFRWMAAAGNASRVESAKETINSSIIALVIVLGSYVILYTINPQLTNLTLYGVNPINPIEQPYALCSNNAPSLIDLKNSDCNPDKETCCGQKFSLKNQGKDQIYCQWDTCPNPQDVCVGPNKTMPRCLNAKEYCVDFGGNDKRSYCPTVDLTIQQAKQWDAKQQKFKQKFEKTGCGFLDVPAYVRLNPVGKDKCAWGYLLSALPQAIIDKDIIGDGYEAQPVSCTEPAAEGVCWRKDDKGLVQNAACSYFFQSYVHDRMVVCKNPDDKRAVAGADGWCLVKKGKRGKPDNTREDYKCWAPPNYKASQPF